MAHAEPNSSTKHTLKIIIATLVIITVAAVVFLLFIGSRLRKELNELQILHEANNSTIKELESQTKSYQGQIVKLENARAELQKQIVLNDGTLEELEGLIISHQRRISELENARESGHFFSMFGQWTPERIRQNLIENSGNLPWDEIFGTGRHQLGVFHEDAILLGRGYAFAQAQFEYDEPGQRQLSQPDVILTYSVIDEKNLHWEIVGYFFPWAWGSLGVVPDNWQNRRRHITDAEKLTIRIHSACYATGLLTETYHLEEIPGEIIWEETIRLKAYHTGIEILDFWYEGRRIYVDLAPSQWPDFTFGTSSFWLHARVVLLTFASFPDVDEIKILFGGLKADLCHHGTYYGYYRIGVGFPESSIAYDLPIFVEEEWS